MSEISPLAGRILIVDDETTALENLAYLCRKEGHDVVTRNSGVKALELLERDRFDLVLTDLRMEKVGGMEILQRVVTTSPDTAVILITGHATLDSAISAMKAGAFHYIAKPFRLDEVREMVRQALELVALRRENRQLKDQLERFKSGAFITQDPETLKLLEIAQQISVTDTSVMISGESGTGKELLAQYIHSSSHRRNHPFIAINCGAFHEELLANELFGHESGAFTGASNSKKGLIESADGGSLFLDEIGEMPSAMQVKLLRVIQEREVLPLGANRAVSVNIRIITATHRSLEEEVRNGRFRQDLFYRLNVIALHLSPLAQRKGDTLLLAHHFMHKHVQRMQKSVTQIPQETIDILNSYPFPGNVRELENIIERGVALASSDKLIPENLPESLRGEPIQVIRRVRGKLPTLTEREEEYILYILQQCDQNKTRAAKILGIDRVSLWRKMKRYGFVE